MLTLFNFEARTHNVRAAESSEKMFSFTGVQWNFRYSDDETQILLRVFWSHERRIRGRYSMKDKIS